MMHECIIEKRRDDMAYVEQYLVRCRCHMDSFVIWRPDEKPFRCTVGTETHKADDPMVEAINTMYSDAPEFDK